jgi:SAM-dependent methyltransferase
VGDAHTYSRLWFETFLGRIDETLVERETVFLARQITPSGTVLDLCCGPGRHTAPLAALGFSVTGIDVDLHALRQARTRAPNAAFVRGDMRCIPLATASADAVLCMWQSFGHFTNTSNVAVFGEMARVLRPGGRMVLDLYHRDFHAAHTGDRVIERDGTCIHEHRAMHGNRLTVRLRYEPSGGIDEFEWRLYTPPEIEAIAALAGLRVCLVCSEFDERVSASGERARMQIVLRPMTDPAVS